MNTGVACEDCQTGRVKIALPNFAVRSQIRSKVRFNVLTALAVAMLLGSSAITGSGVAQARPVLAAKAEKPPVVVINMGPVRYNPAVISVSAGKPVILRFVNKSTIEHEALLGDAKAQDDHEKMMQAMPGMAHDTTKGFVEVKPGKSKDLLWTFSKAGITFVGCHKPAHYKGGMKLRVVVKSSTGIA
jgi:uncharacterized cupredoxin-like copper-binding protein